MSAPEKPWESVDPRPTVTGRPSLRSSMNYGSLGPLNSSTSMGQLPLSAPSFRRPTRILDSGRIAPPIPTRSTPNRQGFARPTVGLYGAGNYGMGSYPFGGGTTSAYGGFGSSYGTGYGGGFGSFGSQGYGTGAYGMNRYPRQAGINSLESRFIQMAEENSRPAFESIESLVHAFGSVSFMMESTFHAMYSSFRAVLGVAENFGRLRSLFGQVFQTFAILRLFQWIYRKLLYYLGVRHDNPGREAVWKEATGQLDPKMRRTFWPMTMFLSLVCGGPFLVWRLLKSIGNTTPPATDSKTITRSHTITSPNEWMTGNSVTLPVAVALYDFTSGRDNELTMKNGQVVWVAPGHLQISDSNWVLVTINGKESGLVPACFIQVVEHRKFMKPKSKQGLGNANQPENPAGSQLPPEIAVGQPTERLSEIVAPYHQLPIDGQLWVHSQGLQPQPADNCPERVGNPYPAEMQPELKDPGPMQPAAPPPMTDEPLTASS